MCSSLCAATRNAQNVDLAEWHDPVLRFAMEIVASDLHYLVWYAVAHAMHSQMKGEDGANPWADVERSVHYSLVYP